ncbi:MAG TPA: acyl-CoA reductase [Polyangiaceae bacterium]|nr:acyl-CoA reductase [Polyangiaceae bacterium]
MAERRARVERLLQAARRLADAQTAEGRRLRERLHETSGLSNANIELGLTRCLETSPSSSELDELLASTPEAPRAHVLLAGNVFVAALRAAAIGVASSARVAVRASRRDPALIEALHELAPGSFELTRALSPAPGDHVWSYGSDSTLAELRASLPRGVWFHAHGSGFGAVAVDARSWSPDDARAIALDTALFDRRGCLSPRVVCVAGSHPQARAVAEQLAGALGELERELPSGPQSPAEAAELRRQRDAATYAFELFEAGSAWVSLSSALAVGGGGRSLHVLPASDVAASLAPWAAQLTCVSSNDLELRRQLSAALPGARLARLGEMQRPALDGPVDRRHPPHGELV